MDNFSLLGVQLENELIDNEASLFSAIEPGDGVDLALKSMVVIKEGQIDNEIRIFKAYQNRFPAESQESLDNVLIDLYKVKKTEDISNSNDSPYMKANHADKAKDTEDISNSNDSLYMSAKHAAVKEKDLEKARKLYYEALENLRHTDRVDSVVKDLANLLRQLGQTDEAIFVIKDNRKFCSRQSQNSLDNLLISIYKSDHNKTAEHINFLEKKLESVENGTTYEGKETKVVQVRRKKNMVKAKKQNIVISIGRERARLLSEIAWLYMLQGNYDTAEEYLRKALSIEPLIKNNQCNLAICLIKSGNISDAKDLLQAVTSSSNEWERPDSYIKSYDRAWKMLTEFEKGDV